MTRAGGAPLPSETTTFFNLQLTAWDWLILELAVTRRRVGLRALARLRWDSGDPAIVDLGGPDGGGRRRAIRALADFERRWPAGTSDRDSQLLAAGFLLARRMLGHSFLAQVLERDRSDVDIAVALADESDDTVLRRMSGRCAPESLIARLRSRCGISYFELLRVHPRPSPLRS